MLPRLPVLSDANRRAEREWHGYVQSVYGSPLPRGQSLDLNAFTFFYTASSLHEAARAVRRRRAAVAWLDDSSVDDDEAAAAGRAPAALLRSWPCFEVCEVNLGDPTYEGTPWIGKAYPGAFVASNAVGTSATHAKNALLSPLPV